MNDLLYFVTTDVRDKKGEIDLSRGQMLDGSGIASMVGFSGMEGKYGVYSYWNTAIYPADALEFIESIREEIHNTPHYILESRGMSLDGPVVRLIRLGDDVKVQEAPLDDLLRDLKLSHDEFRARIRKLESTEDGSSAWDMMLKQENGVWKEVRSR